jgi:cyclopropane fatty-acyl-phospholipid synthase-like methyltransferase
MSNDNYRKFDHDLHARTQAETDFWAQIRRTVNGKPVDEAQITQILQAICGALDFESGDCLLDLACGNGALSSQLFDRLQAYRGVDFSPRLVEVATRHFAKPPAFDFVLSGAAPYVQREDDPERYTKALCYGSFSYFSEPDARTVLEGLHSRFGNISRVFIGNLPDKDRADRFFRDGHVNAAEIKDHESAIGIWRSPQEFIELAQTCGWQASISRMPESYYAAHYRYDALLTR